jgi:hypothetical protein
LLPSRIVSLLVVVLVGIGVCLSTGCGSGGQTERSAGASDGKRAFSAPIDIQGTASDGLGGAFELHLDPNGTWREVDNPVGSFFITTNGTFMYNEASAADKGTFLYDLTHKRIGIVRKFNPNTGQPRSGSEGNVEEMGRTFSWKVK